MRAVPRTRGREEGKRGGGWKGGSDAADLWKLCGVRSSDGCDGRVSGTVERDGRMHAAVVVSSQDWHQERCVRDGRWSMVDDGCVRGVYWQSVGSAVTVCAVRSTSYMTLAPFWTLVMDPGGTQRGTHRPPRNTPPHVTCPPRPALPPAAPQPHPKTQASSRRQQRDSQISRAPDPVPRPVPGREHQADARGKSRPQRHCISPSGA